LVDHLRERGGGSVEGCVLLRKTNGLSLPWTPRSASELFGIAERG
jgi:hypothetical protein